MSLDHGAIAGAVTGLAPALVAARWSNDLITDRTALEEAESQLKALTLKCITTSEVCNPYAFEEAEQAVEVARDRLRNRLQPRRVAHLSGPEQLGPRGRAAPTMRIADCGNVNSQPVANQKDVGKRSVEQSIILISLLFLCNIAALVCFQSVAMGIDAAWAVDSIKELAYYSA
jgi:hypothetical protein